jgi:hypothetical protein
MGGKPATPIRWRWGKSRRQRTAKDKPLYAYGLLSVTPCAPVGPSALAGVEAKDPSNNGRSDTDGPALVRATERQKRRSATTIPSSKVAGMFVGPPLGRRRAQCRHGHG